MLMASHRQTVSFGSSRYSSGSSAWFILRSTWNEILSSNGGGGVAGGERRESDGKVSFFFSLTTTSFLHSLETIFLFQLNGKSPKYKGLMGGISLKSTLRCLPSISSISSFPSYPRPLEFLSFCPLWPHLHYLHQLPTEKTLCTLF